MSENEYQIPEGIFPTGSHTHEFFQRFYSNPNYYEQILVPHDSETGCMVTNATFGPGCYNSWHTHPSGQIVLVTEGRGWYQEEGKPARQLKPGDVVEIKPNVKHWHGAAKDTHYVHIAIKETKTMGYPEWFGIISEEEYGNL